MNTTRWADWYAEVERRLREARRRERRGRRRRPLDGWRLVLRLAERRAGPGRRRGAGQPRDRDQAPSTLPLLPVLKHLVPSFPGIGNDIKKPGVDEHGYTKTPLKAAALDDAGLEARSRPTCRRSPRRCCSSARPRTTSSTRRRAADHRAISSTRRHRRTPREQLPRGDPRQRRPADLRGVGGVHRPGHRQRPEPRERRGSGGAQPAERRRRPGARSSRTTATGRRSTSRRSRLSRETPTAAPDAPFGGRFGVLPGPIAPEDERRRVRRRRGRGLRAAAAAAAAADHARTGWLAWIGLFGVARRAARLADPAASPAVDHRLRACRRLRRRLRLPRRHGCRRAPATTPGTTARRSVGRATDRPREVT